MAFGAGQIFQEALPLLGAGAEVSDPAQLSGENVSRLIPADNEPNELSYELCTNVPDEPGQ